MTIRSSIDERDAIYAKTVAPLEAVMDRLVRTAVMQDREGHDRALETMARYIGQVLAGCWLLGARRAVLLARAAEAKHAHFAAEPLLLVPAVPFEEAIQDILSREPQLAIGYKAVSELYTRDGGRGFALAKSADVNLTRRVQELVAEGLRTGDRVAATRAIAEVGRFTPDYADNVFRTNASTAYTAGTFEQARDPDVAAVMAAFEFTATMDADTRHNHAAAHGLVAPINSSMWAVYKPPLGFRCRCDLRLVSRFELERMGLYDVGSRGVRTRIPPDFAHAGPDPGFRTAA